MNSIPHPNGNMSTARAVLQRLEAFGLKDEGHGKYRCNSPFRPGSDSHAFTLIIDDDEEHGAFFDHVSGEKGTLYELAERMGIPTPRQKRAQVENSKRAYRDLDDYAKAHGAPAEAFVAAEWTGKPVTYAGRPALVFDTKTGTRWRFLDGNDPPYMSSKGYKPSWYRLEPAVELTRDTGNPLVICNGEASTVVAQYWNIPATTVTSGEKGKISEKLLAELKAAYSGPIIVALDCDPTGRKAAAGLVTQLKDHGFDVHAVDLMLGDGGDLADFCKLHTDAAASRLKELPLLETKSAPSFTNTEAAKGSQAEGQTSQTEANTSADDSQDSYPSWPYAEQDKRMFYLKKDVHKNGYVTIQRNLIADFHASISKTIHTEDGKETYCVGGETAHGKAFSFEISAETFADARQLKAHLEKAAGPRCPVAAKMADHLCPVIKKLTAGEVEIQQFNRTGWFEGRFLIPGRETDNIQIVLPRKLPYAISSQAAFEKGIACFRVLIAAMSAFVTLPVLMALLQAPLAHCLNWRNERYATVIVARTGSLKTSFTQAAMCLYGPNFIHDDLITKWGEGATRNAIMALGAHAHDLPFLIDNYKPNTGGGSRDLINILHNLLEGGEKDRLNRNSELRESRPVFCWPIFTCEDIPDEDPASVARMLIVPFQWPRGERNAHLAEAQALSPHLSAVGGAWLDWLESDAFKPLIEQARAYFESQRELYADYLRRRRPDMVNILRVATNLASNHTTGWVAQQHPILGPILRPHMHDLAQGLELIADRMCQATTESLPAKRFIMALQELLISGEIYLTIDSEVAPNSETHATMVGYRDDAGGAYLLVDSAKSEVEKLIGKSGLGHVSNQALYSQLKDLGYVASTGKSDTTKVIKVQGKSIRVLHVNASALNASE